MKTFLVYEKVKVYKIKFVYFNAPGIEDISDVDVAQGVIYGSFVIGNFQMKVMKVIVKRYDEYRVSHVVNNITCKQKHTIDSGRFIYNYISINRQAA